MPPPRFDFIKLHLARVDPIYQPATPHRISSVLNENTGGASYERGLTDFIFGVPSEREDVGRVGARVGGGFQAGDASLPGFSEGLCRITRGRRGQLGKVRECRVERAYVESAAWLFRTSVFMTSRSARGLKKQQVIPEPSCRDGKTRDTSAKLQD